MKVRNLQSYIRFLTGGNDVSQLGNQDDQLLKSLAGIVDSLNQYVGTTTNFATDSALQIFYEFMQNADDAGGSRMGFFFDEKNFIAINDGLPFYTDDYNDIRRKGQLKSFLQRQRGDKFDDKESIGRYGQGSKLMYDLLTSQQSKDQSLSNSRELALQKALLNDCSGPILFSWSAFKHLEHLVSAHSTPEYTGGCSDASNPLLTKIIYTYYPASLGQSVKDYFGNEKVLFGKEELAECIAFVNYIKNKLNIFEYNKGSLFYIRLGEGQYDRLEKVINDGLKDGISTSLAFLVNLKMVQIQNEKIEKTLFNVVEIPTTAEDIKITLAIPKDPGEASKRFCNFYKYFPITDTKYGLNFIINCTAYEVDGSRQRIDFSNLRNKEVMKIIGTSIGAYILQLAQQPDQEILIDIVKNIATIDIEAGADAREIIASSIDDVIKEKVRTCLPVQTRGVKSAEDVRIKKTGLNFNPSDLGFGWDWLSSDLQEYYNSVKNNLGVASSDLYSVLNEIPNNDSIARWVVSLSDTEYADLIEEVYSGIYSIDSKYIRRLPFIRFSDDNVYTLDEIAQNEHLLFLTPPLANLESIIKRGDLVYAGKELLNSEAYLGWYEKTPYLIKDKYLTRFIGPLSEMDLSRAEKKLVFEVFNSLEEANALLKNDFLLFTNKNGEKKPLKKLLRDASSIAPSGLLEPYCLRASELSQDLELSSFLMNERDIWKNVLADWSNIRPKEMDSDLFRAMVRDMESLFSMTFPRKTLPAECEWIYIADNEWVSINSIFYNSSLVNEYLQECDYDKFIEQVLNHTGLQPVPYDYLKVFTDISFVSLPDDSLRTLKECMEEDSIKVEDDVIEKLYAIRSRSDSFFSTFILSGGVDNDNGYQLSLNDRNFLQYYSEDGKLNNFLQQTNRYYLLPRSLRGIFTNETSLLTESDDFATKLINEYGAKPDFFDFVSRQSDQVKVHYLSSLTSSEGFRLSTAITHANNSVFEEGVLKMICAHENWKNHYINYIYINNKKLNEYQYKDTLTVRVRRDAGEREFIFSLAALLPSFQGNSDILEQIAQRLPSIRRLITNLIEYPIDSIPNEIANELNIDQLAFLICYNESKLDTINYNTDIRRYKNLSKIDKNSLLDYFYTKEIFFFSKYSLDASWHLDLNNYILSSNASLVLENETLDQWILDWISVSETEEKKIFLQQAGLNGDNSEVIDFRSKIYEQNHVSNERIKRFVSTERQFVTNTILWAEKTLVWPKEEKKCTEAIHKLQFEYYRATNELIIHFLFFVKNESEEAKFTLCPYEGQNNKTFYIKDIQDEHKRIFVANVPDDYSIIDLTPKHYNEQFISSVQSIGIQECIIESEITIPQDSHTCEEWDNQGYKLWKQNEGEKYSIMLSSRPLPVTYKCRLAKDERVLGSRDTGVAHKISLNNDTYQLYLYRESSDKNVIDLLLEHREKLFGNDTEALFSLLRTGHIYQFTNLISPDDHKLIDDNVDLIKDLFSGVSHDTLNNLSKSEEIKGLLEILINRKDTSNIEELLAKADEKQIKWILDNWDEIMKKNKPTPNELVGYMGEKLLFNYIKEKLSADTNISCDITYVADKEPSYDLLLTMGDVSQYIEVKTTIKSFREENGTIPFYLRRSQQNFIKDKTKTNEDYLLAQISLHDAGLESLYSIYREMWKDRNNCLDNTLKIEIDNGITHHLHDLNNMHLFESNLILLSIKAPELSSDIQLLFG